MPIFWKNYLFDHHSRIAGIASFPLLDYIFFIISVFNFDFFLTFFCLYHLFLLSINHSHRNSAVKRLFGTVIRMWKVQTVQWFDLGYNNFLDSLRILNQRVTSCNLWVTSDYLLHDFWVTFYIGVTSYYLLYGSRIPFYSWVTSYYLLHKLRVNFHVRVTSYYLLHDLLFT